MESASQTLHRIMAQALNRLPAEEVPIAAWEVAAGRAVATKTRAIRFENGTLVVEVPDANWGAQLGAMTPQILSRLNQYTKVERVQFVIARS